MTFYYEKIAFYAYLVIYYAVYFNIPMLILLYTGCNTPFCHDIADFKNRVKYSQSL
jgi:hypothetical protein